MSNDGGRDIEVTMQGKEDYACGFVRGLLIGEHSLWWPVFHADFGIQDETLGETLREWVGISEPLSRFIVPEAALPVVRRALGDPRAPGLSLRAARPVLSASFEFTVAVFNHEIGAKVQAVFRQAPPSVTGWAPKEQEDPDATGTELYSPTHEYELKGTGSVAGPFRDVLYVHEQVRRISQVKETKLALQLGPPLD
jgi:hypothetical protein